MKSFKSFIKESSIYAGTGAIGWSKSNDKGDVDKALAHIQRRTYERRKQYIEDMLKKKMFNLNQTQVGIDVESGSPAILANPQQLKNIEALASMNKMTFRKHSKRKNAYYLSHEGFGGVDVLIIAV